MIIFDTNVVSEAMRAAPDERVKHWLLGLPNDVPAVTAITVGEISVGLALLPRGQRRAAQEADWRRVRANVFGERSFPFDEEAALRFGAVIAERRAAGAPVELADAQIAAIALVRSLPVATRDVAGFAGLGLTLINPWT